MSLSEHKSKVLLKKITYDSRIRAIDTCASYGANLWVPDNPHDQRNAGYLIGDFYNVWIGVVVDPPNWYALKDWLNAGCDILTKGYFSGQSLDQFGYQSAEKDLFSQEFQPNITW